MLKEVIFISENISEEMRSAAEYIKFCGFEASCMDLNSFFSLKQNDMDKHSGLIATDSNEIAERLCDAGFYVIGIQTDANKEEKFPGLKYIFSDIADVDIDSYIKVYQRFAGKPWEILRTDRLIVRETTVEDVDEFYRIYRDSEMTRYMEGLFENPEDEKRYQKDYIEKVYGFMGFGVWTLVREKDNRVIGRAGFSVRNGFDEIELGFLVGKEFQHQGYAYEACRAILDYGRIVLMFDRVQALVKAENEVSIHICEKLGFAKLEEVDVEENIYGDNYDLEQTVSLSKRNYGKYIRMIKYFD